MGFWAVTLPDRELFGTLRGLDPAPRSDELLQHESRFDILGMLLPTILDSDLDRLRDTNETRCHQAGDGTIKLVASVIRNTIRDTDIAARLDGEEFGIIVTNVLIAGRQKLVGRLLVTPAHCPFGYWQPLTDGQWLTAPF
jgi:GGDEF domain-containing protein